MRMLKLPPSSSVIFFYFLFTFYGFVRLGARCELTLLALLDLKPTDSWQLVTSPLMGITPMMNFMAQHYGKT
ncbi:MAG: hypothetical protein ACYTX0_43400, partial [Nostoc sp.]